jgi:predicted NAD/FAD-dependent oxidoreductase
MAAPILHGRRVDLGAAYFTVADDDFAAVVNGWLQRGLARPWTDTLDVFGAEGRRRSSGPMRWAAADGLRSLVHAEVSAEVVTGTELTELPTGFDAVVLAMPDPQAARIAGALCEWVEYEPVIAVAAGWDARTWSLDAGFVNDDPHLAFVADDGARRGDAAPVLVVHTTAELARACLDRPDDAVGPALDAAQRLLGIDAAPVWAHAHRWTFAKPAGTHPKPFFLNEGRLGVCGDSWCPEGSPRVEAAWLSGHRLGRELALQLR